MEKSTSLEIKTCFWSWICSNLEAPQCIGLNENADNVPKSMFDYFSFEQEGLFQVLLTDFGKRTRFSIRRVFTYSFMQRLSNCSIGYIELFLLPFSYGKSFVIHICSMKGDRSVTWNSYFIHFMRTKSNKRLNHRLYIRSY